MSQRFSDDEDYFVPLEDQRVFGAGIKRKRVPFVRPSDDATLNTTAVRQTSEPLLSAASVADRYLSIVLKQNSTPNPVEKLNNNVQGETFSPPSSSKTSPTPLGREPFIGEKRDEYPGETIVSQQLCEVCNFPLKPDEPFFSSSTTCTTYSKSGAERSTPHEASIVHQVCLKHSHPPSHLDRTRHGMRYLASYGWNPDSRLGLGASGREGIREPIKPKSKMDTIGLGVEIDKDALAKKRKLKQQQKEQRQKVNAKQVRKGEVLDKKKGDKLREMFYRSNDIQRYLGGDV